jgi:hypothetical protein
MAGFGVESVSRSGVTWLGRHQLFVVHVHLWDPTKRAACAQAVLTLPRRQLNKGSSEWACLVDPLTGRVGGDNSAPDRASGMRRSSRRRPPTRMWRQVPGGTESGRRSGSNAAPHDTLV